MVRWLLLFYLAVLALPGTLAQVGYGVSQSKSVKGNTLKKVCGGLAAVVAKCSDDPECKGFDMDDDADCGELKTRATASTLEYSGGSTSFCKFLRPSQPGFDERNCGGTYTMWPDADAPEGTDFNCRWQEEGKEKDYCMARGTHLDVMQNCNTKEACGAFVIENKWSGSYGTLKKAYTGRRVPRKGFMLFVRH